MEWSIRSYNFILYFSSVVSIRVHGILHPLLQVKHVSVHSVLIFACAAYSPTHCARKVPFAAAGTDQRSATVSLACVNAALRISCTEHAWCNVIAWIASLTGVTWYERHSCLSQDLWGETKLNRVREAFWHLESLCFFLKRFFLRTFYETAFQRFEKVSKLKIMLCLVLTLMCFYTEDFVKQIRHLNHKSWFWWNTEKKIERFIYK